MNIRETIEQQERQFLSPYACFSAASKGRDKEEEPCDIRTVFQRDRDRIIHCKAFRRLKHKTQVFLLPEGDHYRTRLTHTLEVAQIARTVARALHLNEDLTEAIALGHDLGHTPFGHSGERALNEELSTAIVGARFRHSEQSVRVVEKLERDGMGLNLTWEVRDGILNHGTNDMPHTLEGKVVRICDKIAYINHDIDDAIRAKVLREGDLPRSYTDILGHSVHDRLDCMIHDVIDRSMGQPDIIQSETVAVAMRELRQFMFAHVYTSDVVKAEEKKAQYMLKMLYAYYLENFGLLPNEYIELRLKENVAEEIIVCDYIAGMTDDYAVKKFKEYYVPFSWTE